MSVTPRAPARNRLLAALPKKEYNRLLPELEEAPLTFGETIYEAGERIEHVYFPNNSLISLLTTVGNHEALEVGIVGNDGMAGVSVLLGVGTSRNRAMVQGAGTARRMKASALRKECQADGALPRLLQRYTHALMTQVAQTAACNRFHRVEARLARWLLMTADRVGSDEFRMTQEFLSHMLGVRREGVSKAASPLQKQKLISYVRGHIRILDRNGLEALSCECYRVVRDEYDSFLSRK